MKKIKLNSTVLNFSKEKVATLGMKAGGSGTIGVGCKGTAFCTLLCHTQAKCNPTLNCWPPDTLTEVNCFSDHCTGGCFTVGFCG